MMRSLLLILTFLAFSTAQAAAPHKLRVVTSFSILEDIAKQVGGDKIEITSLVGRNSDIHAYEPKPSDAKLLQHADLFVVNGLGLEGFITRLVESSNFKGDIVEASRGVKPIENTDPEEIEEHGKFDPHAWQSARNVIIYAENVATAFAAKDPQNQAYYNERLKGFILRLRQMDVGVYLELKKIPPKQRSIVVPHNSFAYLGRDYSIRVFEPQGLSTESEPSAKDIAKIIDAIRKQNVHAIFTENIAESPIILQISKEASVPIGGRLYSDALSDASGQAYTYMEFFQYNTNAILNALKNK